MRYFTIDSEHIYFNLPPSLVSVINEKSSVDEPAILYVSILITYLVAGVNPVMRNLRCGFSAFETKIELISHNNSFIIYYFNNLFIKTAQ